MVKFKPIGKIFSSFLSNFIFCLQKKPFRSLETRQKIEPAKYKVWRVVLIFKASASTGVPSFPILQPDFFKIRKQLIHYCLLLDSPKVWRVELTCSALAMLLIPSTLTPFSGKKQKIKNY